MFTIGAKLPVTHFFVYKNKKYPFNFQLFCCFSDYLRKNQKELELEKNIPLISENEDINLDENSIQLFICYCQNQVISITNDNAIPLNKLSHKYEVQQLIDSSKQFIINHHDELIFDIYSYNMINYISDNFDYEKLISEHILDYIQNGKLITLPLNSIYHILSKSKDHIKFIEVSDFLLSCLEKYGRRASVLFTCFDLNEAPSIFLTRLLKDYSEIIDLNFIKGEFLKTLHERQETIIETQREQKLLISELKQEIKQIHKIFEQQKIDEQRKNIKVAYILPFKKMNCGINVDLIEHLNTKDIQINLIKYKDAEFIDIIKSNKKLINSFDVLMLGIDGYPYYELITDEFLELLKQYRDNGGHILFLHDFNSGSKSFYGKEYQPFSNDLGFKGIKDPVIFQKAKFIPNKCDELRTFPFEIDSKFDVADTHETPIYDSKYTIIKSASCDTHYYCENSEKRIADCSMGHSAQISLNEKKLLYNILYHLSQLP